MNVERREAVELVRTCLGLIQPDGVESSDVDEDTHLIGGNSSLDSIALVSLIVEIEEHLHDVYGVSTLLTDDRAMSEKHSPFRTVGSLAELITERCADAPAG